MKFIAFISTLLVALNVYASNVMHINIVSDCAPKYNYVTNSALGMAFTIKGVVWQTIATDALPTVADSYNIALICNSGNLRTITPVTDGSIGVDISTKIKFLDYNTCFIQK